MERRLGAEEKRGFVCRERKDWGVSTSFYRQTLPIFSYSGYEYCIVGRRCVLKFEACAETSLLKEIFTSFLHLGLCRYFEKQTSNTLMLRVSELELWLSQIYGDVCTKNNAFVCSLAPRMFSTKWFRRAIFVCFVYNTPE